MTKKQMETIVKHKENGGLIMKIGPCLDSFASVWEEDGDWWIESQVYVKRKLKDEIIHRLNFYRPVDLF